MKERLKLYIESINPALLTCGALFFSSVILGLFFTPDFQIGLEFILITLLLPLACSLILIRVISKKLIPYAFGFLLVYSVWVTHSKILLVSLGLGLAITLTTRKFPDFRFVKLVSLAIAVFILGLAVWHSNRGAITLRADRTAEYYISAAPLTGGGIVSMKYHLKQNIQTLHHRGLAEAVAEDVTPFPLLWLYFGLPAVLGLTYLGYLASMQPPSVAQAALFGMLLATLFLPSSIWLMGIGLFWLSAVVILNNLKCSAA